MSQYRLAAYNATESQLMVVVEVFAESVEEAALRIAAQSKGIAHIEDGPTIRADAAIQPDSVVKLEVKRDGGYWEPLESLTATPGGGFYC